MAVAVRGHGSAQGDAVATSIATGVFSVAPVAGDAVYAWVSYADTDIITGVADNADGGSNTFEAVGSVLTDGNRYFRLYRAKNIANTTASYVVTASFSGNVFARSIHAAAYSGADTTEPTLEYKRQTQASVGTGTDAVTSGTTTASAAIDDGVYAYTSRGSGTVGIANGTGYSTVASQGGGGGNGLPTTRSEFKVVASAATQAGTFTIDGTSNMLTGAVIIKAAAAGDLDLEPTGLEATFELGTATLAVSLNPVGLQLISEIGTAEYAEEVDFGIGLEMVAEIGEATLDESGDTFLSPTGLEATFELGTATLNISLRPVGLQMVAELGTATPDGATPVIVEGDGVTYRLTLDMRIGL